MAFLGTVYRSCAPKYATEKDLLTGEGSRRNGGRWNPVGLAVVYASLSPETALAETLAHNRYYGIPDAQAMPRTFVSLQVKLSSVLDLRIGTVRQRLQVSLDRILTLDWRQEIEMGRAPFTQTIGLSAQVLGLEGLIVPSAADSLGNNLLLFPENLKPGSEVRILKPDSLHPGMAQH